MTYGTPDPEVAAAPGATETPPSNLAKHPSHSMRAGWLVVGVLPLGVMALLVFFGYLHYSTQVEPDFYREAMRVNPEQYRQAGEAFENRLLQLNTDVRNQEEWVIGFTAEQINGWLAFEMPTKLPELLPKEVSNPRVAFADRDVKVAFRLNTPAWSGVVNLRATVFCTELPNQLAVQIHQLSSGIVPLPLESWSDSIQKGFRKAGFDLEWSQLDGNVVALVTMPEKYLDIEDRQIVVETLEIQGDQVLLSGTSQPLSESTRLARLEERKQSSENGSSEDRSSGHRTAERLPSAAARPIERLRRWWAEAREQVSSESTQADESGSGTNSADQD